MPVGRLLATLFRGFSGISATIGPAADTYSVRASGSYAEDVQHDIAIGAQVVVTWKGRSQRKRL